MLSTHQLRSPNPFTNPAMERKNMITSRVPPIPINACDGSYVLLLFEIPKLPKPKPIPTSNAIIGIIIPTKLIAGAPAGDGGNNDAPLVLAVRNRYGFKKLTNPTNKHTINNVVNTAQLFAITSHETNPISKITDNTIIGR